MLATQNPGKVSSKSGLKLPVVLEYSPWISSIIGY